MNVTRVGAACALAIVMALACGCSERRLRIATTTSVENSGLLESILPSFQRQTAAKAQVLAVGSGRALELLRNGDADVALTHDPEAEAVFLTQIPAARYQKIMFNDFLIVGPQVDAANVRGASSAADAFKRIAAVPSATFVSRGDASGTHTREQQMWRLAGARPSPARLLETGQGMAPTLRIAHERAAYTLTDRATFMQLSPSLALQLLFQGDAALLNTYAVVMAPGTPAAGEASRFVTWIADGDGRSAIASFTISGVAPFGVWPAGQPRDAPDARPR